MPVNTWNFFRAVTVGSDHASWLSQNPQVRNSKILSILHITINYIINIIIRWRKAGSGATRSLMAT